MLSVFRIVTELTMFCFVNKACVYVMNAEVNIPVLDLHYVKLKEVFYL